MNLTIERDDLARVIKAHDKRIDAAVAIQFKDTMRSLMADAPGRILFDMGEVEFVDSSGLGALVAVLKMAGRDQTFELASLTGNVSKVFRLTRMDKVFAIHTDTEAGLKSDAA